jgi:hypothetical protein
LPLQSRLRSLFVTVCTFLILASFSSLLVNAQLELRLEAEQHWETFGVGGTCISGQHNLFVADVDGDGVEEMVTGGWAYYVSSNGTRISNCAPLKVWSWNGQSKNVTLEYTEEWNGNIGVVYAADVDGDGKTEIVTAGGVADEEGKFSAALRFWNWDGESLILRGTYEGVSATSLCVANVEGEGEQEVITVGISSNSTNQLCVWRWDGEILSLEAVADCCASNSGNAASVTACDLNNDGSVEIVTAGYANSLNDSRAQVRVWQIIGNTLSLLSSVEWRLIDGFAFNSAGNVQGNTLVSNVKAADVDGDGTAEILTGGFTYDGTSVLAQLRIWNWTGNVLNLEVSHEWTTQDITELKTIFISDVDNDGRTEVVTSGGTVSYGSFSANSAEKETAQLRVWEWNGESLALEESEDWVIGEGVMAWNVAAGDLKGDGANEIVTVGCMYVGNLCDPDLRVWSVSQSGVFVYLPTVFAVTTVVIVSATLAAFWFARKRRMN